MAERQTEVPSLLEELQNSRKARYCQFGRWLLTASQEIREDLATAFADPFFTGVSITEAIAARTEGWMIDQVREHRRGACKTCPKTVEVLNTDLRSG